MTTLLVVDDSPLVNNLLCDTLTSHGYEVFQAHDATQAYKLLQQRLPDMILLDVVLPDVNGVELCRALRAHAGTRHIPIILITGTASSTSEKVKGLQAGADDYILKPFETDELLERVRAVLRRTQQQPMTPVTSDPDVGQESSEPPTDAAKPLPLLPVLGEALCSPFLLPTEYPSLAPLFLITMIFLLLAGLYFAPGTTLKPVPACLIALVLWGLLVASTVVLSSLTGIALTWKEGTNLFSLAGLPILLKLTGGVVFSALTTLSPFLYSAGPALFMHSSPTWLNRLDLFELWSVALLVLFLRKRPGASTTKVLLITACVWGFAFLAFAGLSRLGATP